MTPKNSAFHIAECQTAEQRATTPLDQSIIILVMFYDNHLWYAPSYLLVCCENAEKELSTNGKLSGDILKVLEEARTACLFALGMTANDRMVRYVQLVDPKVENTPDARIMNNVAPPKGNLKWGSYVDVEIVRYESHSTEKLSDFIKRTKLNDKKVYQDGTVILCGIDKTADGLQLWKDTANDLKDIKNNLNTFTLGRTDPKKWDMVFARVHPDYDNVTAYNVHDVTNTYYKDVKGIQIVEMGGSKMNNPPNAGFNPFLVSAG
jgi:hypothetical protein